MKKILLIIFILLFILLAGCKPSFDQETFRELEKCKSEKYIDTCYAKLGIEKANEDICLKIENKHHKEGCLRTVGIAKADISICDKIKEAKQK